MRLLRYIPILLVSVSFVFTGCTSMLLVKSAWNNNAISVDGNDSDWDDTMFYIPDAQLTAGVRNDSDNLYIILKTTQRIQTFQVMGLGLTIWFDPSGGTGEKFGIHFPLGRQAGGNIVQQTSSDQDNPDSNVNPGSDLIAMTPNELDLLGVNDNGPVRLTVADIKGIQLQLNRSQGGLIYELKVPLHPSPDHPYAINPKGINVGVGFEGGKFEGRESGMRGRGGEGGEAPGEGGGEGMPAGGMGGRGGGMRRGGGEGRSGGQNQRQAPKQIDFWLKVKLANAQ